MPIPVAKNLARQFLELLPNWLLEEYKPKKTWSKWPLQPTKTRLWQQSLG
jgi:hypothetical protein